MCISRHAYGIQLAREPTAKIHQSYKLILLAQISTMIQNEYEEAFDNASSDTTV